MNMKDQGSVYDKWDEQNCDPPNNEVKEREPTSMMPVHKPRKPGPYRPPVEGAEPMPMSHADFNDFVDRHYTELLKTVKKIRGLQKADAEDVLQDTLEKLCQRPEKIDSSKNPTSWIKRAVELQANRFFRDQKKKIEVEGISLDTLITEEDDRERDSDETEAGDPIIGHQKTPDALLVPEHSTLEREVSEELLKLDVYYNDDQYTRPYRLFLQDWTVIELEEEFGLSTQNVRTRLKIITKHLSKGFKDYRV